jgi:hypothetical protein
MSLSFDDDKYFLDTARSSSSLSQPKLMKKTCKTKTDSFAISSISLRPGDCGIIDADSTPPLHPSKKSNETTGAQAPFPLLLGFDVMRHIHCAQRYQLRFDALERRSPESLSPEATFVQLLRDNSCVAAEAGDAELSALWRAIADLYRERPVSTGASLPPCPTRDNKEIRGLRSNLERPTNAAVVSEDTFLSLDRADRTVLSATLPPTFAALVAMSEWRQIDGYWPRTSTAISLKAVTMSETPADPSSLPEHLTANFGRHLDRSHGLLGETSCEVRDIFGAARVEKNTDEGSIAFENRAPSQHGGELISFVNELDVLNPKSVGPRACVEVASEQPHVSPVKDVAEVANPEKSITRCLSPASSRAEDVEVALIGTYGPDGAFTLLRTKRPKRRVRSLEATPDVRCRSQTSILNDLPACTLAPINRELEKKSSNASGIRIGPEGPCDTDPDTLSSNLRDSKGFADLSKFGSMPAALAAFSNQNRRGSENFTKDPHAAIGSSDRIEWMRERIIEAVVKHYADRGDVQTVVVLLVVFLELIRKRCTYKERGTGLRKTDVTVDVKNDRAKSSVTVDPRVDPKAEAEAEVLLARLPWTKRQVQEWVMCYLELLYRLRQFSHATEVARLCGDVRRPLSSQFISLTYMLSFFLFSL